MKNTITSDQLAYNLYQDNAHVTIWGSGGGTGEYTYSGTGASDGVAVYAKIPGGQSEPVGTYSDTVTITATF